MSIHNDTILGGWNIMEMKKDFYELYNNFAKRAEEKNRYFRERLINLELSFDSKEMLSLVVSEGLMEDIEVIEKLQKEEFSNRYIDFIIRNMSEQVIEYLYIMKNPGLIKEYFGAKLDDDWNGKNSFDGLRRTGATRFEDRKKVGTMAKAIGEKKAVDGKIPLYEIFSLKAELEHHSYFHYMLDVLYYSGNRSESKDELDYIFLRDILRAFIKVYDTIQ